MPNLSSGEQQKEPQPTPVVIRHANGPSAWVTMETATSAQDGRGRQGGQSQVDCSKEAHPRIEVQKVEKSERNLQGVKGHPDTQSIRAPVSQCLAHAELPSKMSARTKVVYCINFSDVSPTIPLPPPGDLVNV